MGHTVPQKPAPKTSTKSHVGAIGLETVYTFQELHNVPGVAPSIPTRHTHIAITYTFKVEKACPCSNSSFRNIWMYLRALKRNQHSILSTELKHLRQMHKVLTWKCTCGLNGSNNFRRRQRWPPCFAFLRNYAGWFFLCYFLHWYPRAS